MRHHVLCLVPMLALAVVGSAQATGVHDFHLQCNYSSDYDIQIQSDGLMFTRDSDHPRSIFMHDGQLRLDGRTVAVSRDDVVRLRQYEQQVRDLVPMMAGIARDGLDLGYAALTTVAATLDDNGDDRSEMLQSLRDRHEEAVQQVDDTLGRGTWKAGDAGEIFNDNMQKTIAELVGRVTGNAVSDALSGDANRLASLQARANALDGTLDKAIDEPAEKLGQRAQGLCPRLASLEQLQRQFDFRLDGGERLQLLAPDKDVSNKASQYAQR
ncbi:DUF2884 family protein [Dyella mobilis]|uniref:DUF2884 family protein n=1 Tax=Dyella mobilis TaxID=1849582 RepID=A0ABS2KNE5_9GAMM|nr:DUF2884 family protein [Dyella mobilis]MBM7132418.1 DUF2884 family protein [Dyella mobilis]GLQ95594.1 hypothetical protein GCM10007863_00120 [Dyella mobilis]